MVCNNNSTINASWQNFTLHIWLLQLTHYYIIISASDFKDLFSHNNLRCTKQKKLCVIIIYYCGLKIKWLYIVFA